MRMGVRLESEHCFETFHNHMFICSAHCFSIFFASHHTWSAISRFWLHRQMLKRSIKRDNWEHPEYYSRAPQCSVAPRLKTTVPSYDLVQYTLCLAVLIVAEQQCECVCVCVCVVCQSVWVCVGDINTVKNLLKLIEYVLKNLWLTQSNIFRKI